MDRGDWVLLLLSRDALGVDGPAELDPVRIQKGMFLLSQRGPAPGLYNFGAYNWGPFDKAVYADLDGLVDLGLVAAERQRGQSWSRYEPTPAGEARARDLASTLEPESVDWLGQTRRFLTTRSFNHLLRDIYEAFPEYTGRSLFRG